MRGETIVRYAARKGFLSLERLRIRFARQCSSPRPVERHRGFSGPRRIAAILLLSIATASSLRALDPQKQPGQYGHDEWTSQDGLPGEAVYQILQSPDGYLWLRTSAGLVRFDGVRFVLMDLTVAGKALHEPIKAIALSAGGDLLIRTPSRTLLRKDGVFSDYLPPAPLPDGNVRAIFETSRRQVLIGGDDQIYETGNQAIKLLRKGVGWIFDFAEDHTGTVWIGTTSGIYLVRDGVLSTSPWNLTNHTATALSEDREHNLWVGTLDGLYRTGPARTAPVRVAPQQIKGEVNATLVDRNGNLWIASSASGLMRLRDGRVSSFRTEDGLTDNSVLSLFEDREGSLWVGTATASNSSATPPLRPTPRKKDCHRIKRRPPSRPAMAASGSFVPRADWRGSKMERSPRTRPKMDCLPLLARFMAAPSSRAETAACGLEQRAD